uniref:Dynein axonemal intermediate chain 4 n=1 Tax=Mola mola TaxID=94237 RepID=A0A3Q3VSY7_MOLML
EMLDEAVELHLSETDTITLLDFLTTAFSPCSYRDENFRYAELCKNRRGNDKYMARSAQTFNGALKEKEIQTDKIVMVDEGTATISCIYDSLSDPFETPQSSSTTSPSENEWYVNSFNNESDPNLILNSEALHQSFLMMERVIMASIFQPRLAAYRQLPILPGKPRFLTFSPACELLHSCTLWLLLKVEPKMEEQKDDEEESSLHATLERLWVFSCELTRGWNITSMALNKKDPDIMAVGYSDFSYGNWTPGLICCWSLKSLKWPEKVFHCDSGVTALDFSINNPSQLAVGMLNGTMAIYNILIHNNFACIANSNECPNKHLHAVWQIRWTQEERAVLSSEDKAEALVSVSADGRITKWIFCTNGLYSTDLMKLQRLKKIENNKSPVEETENEDNLLPTPIPGLCFDFHPRDPSIYLTGTWEGQIHKCSVSNNQFLQTYEHHFCPVNSVQWSPFHPDMFLSCSSDWTIQLWKQDRLTPLLSFPCTHRDVYAIRWSPDCSTIFAAIDEQQMEIWDLKSSLLAPTIVHHMAPGVRMTALLFARGTNCVLVGDSEGQVSVYQLKNLSVKEDIFLYGPKVKTYI